MNLLNKKLEKKVIVFDLDGTIAESKQSLDDEMSGLLLLLMRTHIVAIASGGSFQQYQKQFLPFLKNESNLSNLVLLPTSGASMYKYSENSWTIVYEEKLSLEEFEKINSELLKALKEKGLESAEKFGDIIEYRRTQVTFSGLGQDAPLSKKELWDTDQSKRKQIVDYIASELSDFEIRIGGTTSIDINKKGIDKAHGVRKLSEVLSIPISDMIYVGDALYEGGNDASVIKSGIDCHAVKDVAETKEFIRSLI